MADGDNPSGGGLNLGALSVGAVGLFTVIGGLSLSGNAGRLLRNDPRPLAYAVVLVLVGAAFLAAAGLPATGHFLEVVLSLLGVELTLAGLLVGVLAAVDSAGAGELPAVTAQLSADGKRVTGKVEAGNMRANARLVLMVMGAPGQTTGQGDIIESAYVGPDGDGKVELPFDVPIPARGFTNVSVSSWMGDGDRAKACEPKSPPSREHGTGCVVLATRAAMPSVSATWRGRGVDASRLEIHVVAAGRRRVGLVVNTKPKASGAHIYRGLLAPGADGTVDATVNVPVRHGLDLVCVGAKAGHAPADSSCDGTDGDLESGGATWVVLQPPPTPKDPPAEH
jgi:hypothetical protein